MTFRPLDVRTLREWPLPALAHDADKEERGRVVVVGGSREIAGAVQLAGVAAMRAGAGKLVIATAASVAVQVGRAVPEARVIALPESGSGALRADGLGVLADSLEGAAAVLVGPGLMDPEACVPFIVQLLALCRGIPVVLDAGAMDAVAAMGRFEQPVLVTPHAGEMAHLTGIAKEAIARDPESVARRASAQWNASVALKGAATLVATPDGGGWRHDGGHPGLATSGSGDVLAGLIAGFAARGATLEQACAWGVVLHALAGRTLARSVGAVGYLARELPGVVPGLVEKAARPLRRSPAPKAR
ncbi:NAD(P)H-hydrate dehydratase [Ramlibacter sp. PS4R-6]|uniref:NAD(P)H-hydrate dehydratase n=1 Tax=Ramlibacter sp. PS4R-6 TaxID=3133438 RepID=UPI0030B6B62D